MNRRLQHPILRIFRKELYRFLTDRRILVAILLPGILIYAIYSLMGGAFAEGLTETASELTVAAYGEPSEVLPSLIDSYNAASETESLRLVDGGEDLDWLKSALSDGTVDLIVCLPSGFDAVTAPGTAVPEIRLYYDSSSAGSQVAFSTVTALLEAYESSLSNCFDVNRTQDTYDLASPEAISTQIFSMMMPMLLIMLLFSGCMTATPESIAGEKERGTVATLLITPMKRWHLAVGKVLGSAVTALLSAVSSFVGVMLSLPKLIGEETVSGAVYGTREYLLILAVMLSSVLLFVSIVSVLSALSSGVKEANTMLLPVMILVMGVGLLGMLGLNLPDSPLMYLIPIYGSVSSLSAIFACSITPTAILLTVASCLVCAALLILLLARMLSSERVMFKH